MPETKDETIARLQAELLAAKSGGPFRMKITEKGCLQVRGLRGLSVKFGLSLYPQAYLDLLTRADEIRRFIETNRSLLSWEKKAV